MNYFIIFLCGYVFALGLEFSGMTQPSIIVGFLDFTGHWNPSLLVVMASSALVYYVAQRFIMRRDGPILVAGKFDLPTRTFEFQNSMLVGNVLFGIGWGMIGLCPGLAIVSSVTGNFDVLIFLVSMTVGMYLYGAIDTRLSSSQPDGGAGLREQAVLVALAAVSKKHHRP